VHSSASGNRQWSKLIGLLQTRYRVIAINLFGYGDTSAWPGERPLMAADQAELIAAIVASVPGPIALVGHSLGGVVALEAAAKFGKRTGVVVAFEPILFADLKVRGPSDAFEEIAGMGRRFGELAERGDWDAVGRLFIDYWAAEGTWDAMPEKSRQNTHAMLPPVVREWEMVMTGTRPLDQWQALSAPVHVIHAEDTRAPTRAIANLIGMTYPHWHAHAVASGGHMAPLARPDLINPIITKAIDAALARPALA
jgi:pimeloyl-ACP methyl ester carboxylesterase